MGLDSVMVLCRDGLNEQYVRIQNEISDVNMADDIRDRDDTENWEHREDLEEREE